MNRRSRNKTAAAFAALALAALTPLSAQITVDASANWKANSKTLTGTFDASGSA